MLYWNLSRIIYFDFSIINYSVFLYMEVLFQSIFGNPL